MSVSVFNNKLELFFSEKQILGDDINWICMQDTFARATHSA